MGFGAGLAGGLAAGLDAYQNQIDRQRAMKLQQLKLQQETMQMQYLQQQAQVGAMSDKLQVAQALQDAQPEQAPPSPYDVSGPQPRPQQAQQGGPSMGGLPGAQPMPGGQPQGGGGGGNPLMGPIPAQAMARAGLGQGGQQGGGAPQQAQMQAPQQQGGGGGGLPPPPTMNGAVQMIAQQAQRAGANLQDPMVQQSIVAAARKNFPAMQQQWKDQAEQFRLQQGEQDRREAMQMREQDHQDNLGLRREEMALAQSNRAQSRANQGWELFQSKDGTLLRVNKDTGEVKPMDAKDVSKVGSGANQPSADDIKTNAKAIANYEEAPPGRGSALSTKTMAEVMRINPNYDAKTFQQRQRAYTAFSTGKQGDTVRSLGVADSHLQVLGDLATGLHNHNIKMINSAAQSWSEQTGSEAPTDFDAVKAIVADEVSKAVIGAGAGTGQDRENILRPFNRANSPQQLAGAISNYRKLMSGQLSGLRRQYENSTGRKDFDKLLPSDMQGGETASAAQSGGWSFEPVK